MNTITLVVIVVFCLILFYSHYREQKGSKELKNLSDISQRISEDLDRLLKETNGNGHDTGTRDDPTGL